MNLRIPAGLLAVVSLSLALSSAVASENDGVPAVSAEVTVVIAGPAEAPAPVPHCEVPCGIYSDQMRFEMMLEDQATIAKAITSVNEFVTGFQDGPPTGTTLNQMTRWINTKELHATNTQEIIAQYFMTQRIKPENEKYAIQLAAAHKVMVLAMKCKQDVSAESAEALKAAIFDLYRAYEGKEPAFHAEEKKAG